MIDFDEAKRVVEAMLLVADEPLSASQLTGLLSLAAENQTASEPAYGIADLMSAIAEDCTDRGFELVQVASGYRFQIRQELNDWVGKLWQRKPPRYSRALLETLALIAYRQPITRGEIEAVRGVAVNSNTIRTLLDRDWIREIGQKEAPGRPMMYGTTSAFLDYFNLRELRELPPLSDVTELGESFLSAAMSDETDETSTAPPQNVEVAQESLQNVIPLRSRRSD